MSARPEEAEPALERGEPASRDSLLALSGSGINQPSREAIALFWAQKHLSAFLIPKRGLTFLIFIPMDNGTQLKMSDFRENFTLAISLSDSLADAVQGVPSRPRVEPRLLGLRIEVFGDVAFRSPPGFSRGKDGQGLTGRKSSWLPPIRHLL